MQVDTTAMLQGICDARDAKEISHELYSKLCERIMKVSEPGSVGRLECDYEQLMCQLGLVPYDGDIDPEWVEFSMLWKRLGDSLASGITVAN